MGIVWTVDAAKSAEAQQNLQLRLSAWLIKITAHEGFYDWKNKQLMHTLLSGLVPETEIDRTDDFVFPPEIQREHDLVTGYYSVIRSLLSLRECEFYFRRYPFRNRGVTREAHLRTCCDLYFSRVYQFKTRWLRQLKRVARRTRPKGLPVDQLERQFEQRFDRLLSARNKLHHEEDYSDIELDAVGLGDLLAFGDNQLEWAQVSRSSYRRIAGDWVRKVRATADALDLFAGAIAQLMLERCDFLPDTNEGELRSSNEA